MITSLNRFESLEKTSIPNIQTEIDYLRDTLEVLRATGEISNDAFLEAGSIQGGLSLILNLISQDIPKEEADSQLESLKERARTLEESYSGLDDKIESRR
tara:strand:+ start:226 stop:525 length:300 start_codon:yes stop_codon:yes gene_type:complete